LQIKNRKYDIWGENFMKLATSQAFKKIKAENKIEVNGQLLKKLQSTLLEMMRDLSIVLEKYGFYYSLCGGTALGAVRHKGFIPWDDDIDIFMHRKDLVNFYKVFEKELGDKYHLHSMDLTPELGIPMMRIHKKGTIYIVDDTLDCDECGVYIDICLLENAPNNRILRFFHGIGSLYFGFCVSCSRFYSKREIYRKQFKGADDDIRKIIEKKISWGKLLSWRKLERWTLKYSKWNGMCKNNNSKYVVCPTGTKHYFGEIFPRKIYMNTVIVDFETEKFRLISNYDWALKRLYGDYMTIPPKEKRETHFVLDIKI